MGYYSYKRCTIFLLSFIYDRSLLISYGGQVISVSAFSPLYFNAFQHMARESPKLRKGLDILEKKADISKDYEEVSKIEEELIRLHDVAHKGEKLEPDAVSNRRKQLITQLSDINKRLEKKENQLRELEA